MRTHMLILLSLVLLGLTARPAAADKAAPWAEGSTVGSTLTAHAWVIALNPEQTAYGVLVHTDTLQPILIRATAEKDVVAPSALGRWALVKATVTKRLDPQTVEIQILKVTPVEPAADKAQP